MILVDTSVIAASPDKSHEAHTECTTAIGQLAGPAVQNSPFLGGKAGQERWTIEGNSCKLGP